jgi:hypothetical protein
LDLILFYIIFFFFYFGFFSILILGLFFSYYKIEFIKLKLIFFWFSLVFIFVFVYYEFIGDFANFLFEFWVKKSLIKREYKWLVFFILFFFFFFYGVIGIGGRRVNILFEILFSFIFRGSWNLKNSFHEFFFFFFICIG